MASEVFDWFEYIVFSIMLLLSTMIGIIFCCSKGGQHTVAEYYLGNKELSIFPVAMSLIASFISGITLLGLPSEIYYNGPEIIFNSLAELIIFIVNTTMYQPVFYNLQIISLYEYLEMRFNHKVRVVASALFAVAWVLYMPIVIYAPALAFNQVSGLSVHVIAPLVCLVCIFYTTAGGLKAVVWADALQASMMLCAIIVVMITGLSKVGGAAEVFSTAEEGKRLEIFNMDPDPTKRLTFWSSSIGITFMWLSDITSPVQVQRYLALPTLKAARIATFILLIGVCTFYLLSAFMGLIIYKNYQNCDPLSANMIKRADQILPLFILDVAGHLRGLPGLFVAGIVCAALSTLSTGMNTLSGTIYEDFVEPMAGKKSERTASNIMKIISLIIGAICIALVSLVEKLGNIVDVGMTVSGVTGGSIFAIFTMGVMMPKVNAQGAFYGGLISSILMMWTAVGHELAPKCFIKKPISIEGCDALLNATLILDEECPEMSTAFKIGFPLYKLTTFYYGLLGFLLCISIGYGVSYITGFNDPSKVKPELLSPVIRGYVTKKDSEYTPVQLKQTNDKIPT